MYCSYKFFLLKYTSLSVHSQALSTRMIDTFFFLCSYSFSEQGYTSLYSVYWILAKCIFFPTIVFSRLQLWCLSLHHFLCTNTVSNIICTSPFDPSKLVTLPMKRLTASSLLEDASPVWSRSPPFYWYTTLPLIVRINRWFSASLSELPSNFSIWKCFHY